MDIFIPAGRKKKPLETDECPPTGDRKRERGERTGLPQGERKGSAIRVIQDIGPYSERHKLWIRRNPGSKGRGEASGYDGTTSNSLGRPPEEGEHVKST